MIRRILAVAVLSLAILLLQGCPKGITITVFNNSNEGLFVLTQNNEHLKWDAGVSLSFRSGGRGLQAMSDGNGRIVPLLSVKKGVKLFSYHLSSYDFLEEYTGHSSDAAFTSGALEYNFQLEPDGYLYIVKPGVSFPAGGLEPQPPGYPIKPAG